MSADRSRDQHLLVSTVSNGVRRGTGDDIIHTLTRGLSHSSQDIDRREEEEKANEKDGPIAFDTEEWHLLETVRQAKLNDPAEGRRLGVTWSHLTVKGVQADAVVHDNFGSQFNVLRLIKENRGPKPMKTIIDGSSGCVKPGEMLLVLGRPGSGCTTLLKMLANRRKGYVSHCWDRCVC
jgi:ABC-type glutathione transport system ATPase component